MEKCEKDAIRDNLAMLTDDLQVKTLYPVLEQKRIFTKTMIEYIEHAGPRHAQAQKLLQDIRARGPGAFDDFLWCLEYTDQLHLANTLRNARDRLRAGGGHAPGGHALGSHAAPAGPSQATGLATRSFPVSETAMEGQPVQASPDATPETDYYPIEPNAPGVAFILNNKKFHTDHEERLGSEKDVVNLKALFIGLGFQVQAAEDLSCQDLKAKLNLWSKLDVLKEASSCVIAMMSHGEEGYIISADGVRIPIRDLVSYFNGIRCPALSGKPKMFVIQACRGKEMDTGAGANRTDGPSRPRVPRVEQGQNTADANAMKKIPAEADIVLAYSTTPGYVSWRNSLYGSWYIDAFCKVFQHQATRDHVVDLLVKVNHEVSTHFSEQENMQMPQPAVALRKKWFMLGRPH